MAASRFVKNLVQNGGAGKARGKYTVVGIWRKWLRDSGEVWNRIAEKQEERVALVSTVLTPFQTEEKIPAPPPPETAPQTIPPRPASSVRRYWPLIVLLLCSTSIYIWASLGPVLWDETEGQYAGAGREMLQSRQWLVPTNNGVPRMQKPPLVYWLIRLSLGAFGVNEFAARLPNALATIAWILVIYLIGERLDGPRRGLFAAAIFASLFGLFLLSHFIMPEPFLGLFISLTFWCLLSASQQHRNARRWFLAAWIFMGLGVMAKGLHGALIPLAVAALSTMLGPQARPFWRGLWSPGGLLLFAAMVAPWYVAMEIRFPGFLAEHFINEQVGHLFDKRFPPDTRSIPLGLFWLEHLFLLFPWILFVPAAIWSWRRHPLKHAGRRNPERVLWLWIGLTAIGVSLASRQDYYTMTAWGAAAIWLARLWTIGKPPPRAWLVVPFLVIALLGGAGVAVAELFTRHVLAAPIAAAPAVARGDLIESMNGFSLGAWRDCLRWMEASALALLAGGAAGAWLVCRGKNARAGLLLAAVMAVPFVAATRGRALMAPYYSLAEAAAAINRAAAPDAIVVCENDPHYNSSLFFYLGRPVYWVHAEADPYYFDIFLFQRL